MIMWLRRWRHVEPSPPPSVRDEVTVDLAVLAARARAAEAGRMLEQARAREPVVRARVRRARAELARNGLAELFDQALGASGGGAS